MNKKNFFVKLLIFAFILVFVPNFSQAVESGDLIKIVCASDNFEVCQAVYYLGADGKRYVFSNEKTYLSWYRDFSLVENITRTEMEQFPIGGNVTYKPGAIMVKITTDPKVYAVSANGVLRWIVSEEIATGLYGENWTELVDDIPDAFFENYKIGEDIEKAADFNPHQQQIRAISINIDKDLIEDSDDSSETEELTPANSIEIENLSIKNITTDSFVVFWETRSLADSEVFYSSSEITSYNPGFFATDFNLTKNHSLTITGLSPSTTYYIEVKSAKDDKSGRALATATTLASEAQWPKLYLTQNYKNLRYFQLASLNKILASAWVGEYDNLDNIYFSRISDTGHKLDNEEKISANNGQTSYQALALSKSDDEFGLFWSEVENNLAKIKFKNISVLGEVSPDTKIVYEDSFDSPPTNLAVAKSNNGYGLVWTETRPGDTAEELYFISTDWHGNPQTAVKKISEKNLEVSSPTIAWSGYSFGISWVYNEDSSYVYYIAVDNNGAKSLFPAEKMVSQKINADSASPSIYWDGNSFGIVWTEKDVASQYLRSQVNFQAFNDGGATDSKNIIITNYDAKDDAYWPKIIWANDMYNIAWVKNNNSIYFSGMDQSYSFKREIASIISGAPVYDLKMERSDDNFIFVWKENNDLILTFGK